MKRFLIVLGIIALGLLGDQGGRPVMVCRLGVCTPAPVVAQVPGPSLALFNSPYYACGQNWYVGNWGQGAPSDANNGTSQATPWATLNHANGAITVTGGGSWCVNVANGTYAAGVSATAGGTTASSAGYVVYRCQSLDGCTITDPGNQTNSAAMAFGANYLIIDGFVVTGTAPAGASNQVGFGISQSAGNVFSHHHVWAINNIVSKYGQSGMQLNGGEFIYAIHNTIFLNSRDNTPNSGNQGSGISIYSPIAIASYTPSGDDLNNSVTGNTGGNYRQFLMWNVLYNNCFCATGQTDGNGIIMDDWQGDQQVIANYTNGGLIAFNISYNNGGVGIHVFASSYVTVANNSAYNDQIDPNSNGFGGNIDDNGSYAGIYINNVSYSVCHAGTGQVNDTAMGIFGTNTTWFATLSGNLTNSPAQTSVALTSATNMPGGATWTTAIQTFPGRYALPGGNMIQIDSEVMLVTAGFGTTSLTVQRGYLGTTVAAHTAAVNDVAWIQGYYSNNVTIQTGAGCGGDVVQANACPSNCFYSSTQNKQTTNPLWVDVGNTSQGTDITQPVGTNFALQGSSPAIGYGTTASPFDFLAAQASDAGACARQLTACP